MTITTFQIDEATGAVYALDGDTLITTPLFEDMTFDTAVDNWTEVELSHVKADDPVIYDHLLMLTYKLDLMKDTL